VVAHLKELSDLFLHVVRLAREMGLVKLGTLAMDGTNGKANASSHKAMSSDRSRRGGALAPDLHAVLWRGERRAQPGLVWPRAL